MDEDCPLFLKPRLRLFLSADIVGSTSLKQSQVNYLRDEKSKVDFPWFSIIQGFYIESRISFFNRWHRIADLYSAKTELCGEEPRLWKTIGDEVLFTKVLTDYRQLATTLKCWIEALRDIRRFLKSRDSRLDVKSTAWIAGFPVKNKDVVISSSSALLTAGVDDYFVESGKLLNKYYSNPDSDEVSIDFVGPSVDVGFRLGGHSTSRRFVVSVGIPYILSAAAMQDEDLDGEIGFHYSGNVVLKGVFGGLPYPLFWIDMGDTNSFSRLEDALTRESPCEARAVQKYCAAFYKEQPAYTFRPFIYEEAEHLLTNKPDWYDPQLNRLIQNFLKPVTEISDDGHPATSSGGSMDEDSADLIASLSVEPKSDES